MTHIIGQHDCKADAKGRVILPISLKNQLLPVLKDGFVIKRSVFQQCLEIYPKEEFDVLMKKDSVQKGLQIPFARPGFFGPPYATEEEIAEEIQRNAGMFTKGGGSSKDPEATKNNTSSQT